MQLLLTAGADVRAKDKGGLIPLHNACSYGHFEVCEMLIGAAAASATGPEQVHAADLWHYTPLHEAASKARAEVCSLLLAHGADPHQATIHGKTALDLAPSPDLRERILYEHRGESFISTQTRGIVLFFNIHLVGGSLVSRLAVSVNYCLSWALYERFVQAHWPIFF